MSKYFTCVESDCRHEFELTDEDLDFYSRKITDKKTGELIQMQLPKRCPECREKKRAKKTNQGY